MQARLNPTRLACCALCALVVLLLAAACYPVIAPNPSPAAPASAAAPVAVSSAPSLASAADGSAKTGDRLVFASDRSGSTELYIVAVPPAGSAPAGSLPATQLTHNGKLSTNPAVSPDGQWIAYVLQDALQSTTPQTPSGDLWLVSLDGQKNYNLTQSPAANFWQSWSPDGKQIAYASNRSAAGASTQWSIWVQDVAPLLAGQAPAPRMIANNGRSPVWSSDGTQIAYLAPYDSAGHAQLYTVKPDGSGQLQLTDHKYTGSGPGMDTPAWSPDGRWMLLPVDFTVKRQLVLLPVDGTTAPIPDGDLRIVTPDQSIADEPVWDADGRWVVFRGGDRYTGIDLMDMQSGEVRQIVKPSAGQPSLSADGSRVAYTPDTPEIMVVNRDGSNPINVTNNPANDNGPAAWVPSNHPKR
jgi:TolB protein